MTRLRTIANLIEATAKPTRGERIAALLPEGRRLFDEAGYVDGVMNPWQPSNREAYARAYAEIAA